MTKSYKKRASSLIKSTSKNINKVLPVVDNGIKTASYVAKGVAKETIPIVEKGVSAVYGTMNTGFNLGVSEAKNIGKGIKNYSKKNIKKGGKRGHSRRRRNSTRRRH